MDRRILKPKMCVKYPVILKTLGIGTHFERAVPVWSKNARKIGYWSVKIAANARGEEMGNGLRCRLTVI